MTEPVLLFDGFCHLCSGVVRFFLERDTLAKLLYCPAQSPRGEALLAQHSIATSRADATVILMDNGKIYFESDAILRALSYLPWPWSWAWAGRVLPRALRDSVYRWVARHRYRWFGRRDSCFLPRPEWQGRFLQ